MLVLSADELPVDVQLIVKVEAAEGVEIENR
jgi:hypothetical protein